MSFSLFLGGISISLTFYVPPEFCVELAGAKFHNAKRRLSVLVFC